MGNIPNKSTTTLAIMFTLIAGCASPNLPPPYEFEVWNSKNSTNAAAQKKMLACGFKNPHNNNQKMSHAQYAEAQQCMNDNGYIDTSGFDVCALRGTERLDACRADKRRLPDDADSVKQSALSNKKWALNPSNCYGIGPYQCQAYWQNEKNFVPGLQPATKSTAMQK